MNSNLSPWRILTLLSVSVFAIESLAMVLLGWLPPMSDGAATLLDATLLTILLFPIFYFYVYRPYTLNLNRLHNTQESLRLSALVFDHSSEAMLITDALGTILDVNPAFTAITGFEAAEAIGRKPNLLSSGLQNQAFYQNLWHSLTTMGHWEGEIINRRKDGTPYVEWLTINAARDTTGKIQRYVAQFVDITRKKSAEELIWRQANFDPLTNLPNRSLFFDRLSREILQAMRSNKKVALFFIDLDGFKAINDELGHQAGDVVLKTVAHRLLSCLRESDTVARLGGDEFALVLPDLERPEQAIPIAQKILQSLQPPIPLTAHPACQVSASIGISLYPDNGFEMDTLLSAADSAMYESKKQGKHQFSFSQAMPVIHPAQSDWITLDASHLVGVTDIDREHQELVTLVNEMNRSLKSENRDGVWTIFEEIFQRVDQHFATEDALMEKLDYPDRVAHQHGHEVMKNTLARIRESLSQSNEMLASQLLKNWVVDHVQGADKDLGDYIKSRGNLPPTGPATSPSTGP